MRKHGERYWNNAEDNANHRVLLKAKGIYAKSKSVDDFLEKFASVYEHLHLDGGNVYIIYPKCYCSRVNKIHYVKLSGTYCYCSVGWAKALFEGVLGRPVKVVRKNQ